MLGALLEKSNVPYAIFERSTTLKPLGKPFTSKTHNTYTQSSTKKTIVRSTLIPNMNYSSFFFAYTTGGCVCA